MFRFFFKVMDIDEVHACLFTKYSSQFSESMLLLRNLKKQLQVLWMIKLKCRKEDLILLFF